MIQDKQENIISTSNTNSNLLSQNTGYTNIHKLPCDLESIGIIVHQAMKLTPLLVSSFLLCHSIVDIVSASPSGFMKSSLTHIPGTLRWNMTGTWTPIASQAGAHILCLYAEDSVR